MSASSSELDARLPTVATGGMASDGGVQADGSRSDGGRGTFDASGPTDAGTELLSTRDSDWVVAIPVLGNAGTLALESGRTLVSGVCDPALSSEVDCGADALCPCLLSYSESGELDGFRRLSSQAVSGLGPAVASSSGDIFLTIELFPEFNTVVFPGTSLETEYGWGPPDKRVLMLRLSASLEPRGIWPLVSCNTNCYVTQPVVANGRVWTLVSGEVPSHSGFIGEGGGPATFTIDGDGQGYLGSCALDGSDCSLLPLFDRLSGAVGPVNAWVDRLSDDRLLIGGRFKAELGIWPGSDAHRSLTASRALDGFVSAVTVGGEALWTRQITDSFDAIDGLQACGSESHVYLVSVGRSVWIEGEESPAGISAGIAAVLDATSGVVNEVSPRNWGDAFLLDIDRSDDHCQIMGEEREPLFSVSLNGSVEPYRGSEPIVTDGYDDLNFRLSASDMLPRWYQQHDDLLRDPRPAAVSASRTHGASVRCAPDDGSEYRVDIGSTVERILEPGCHLLRFQP